MADQRVSEQPQGENGQTVQVNETRARENYDAWLHLFCY